MFCHFVQRILGIIQELSYPFKAEKETLCGGLQRTLCTWWKTVFLPIWVCQRSQKGCLMRKWWQTWQTIKFKGVAYFHPFSDKTAQWSQIQFIPTGDIIYANYPMVINSLQTCCVQRKKNWRPKLQARAGTPKVELHVYYSNLIYIKICQVWDGFLMVRGGTQNNDVLTVELLGVGDDMSP